MPSPAAIRLKRSSSELLECFSKLVLFYFKREAPVFVTVTIEGEARKLSPAKQSLFQHAPSSLSLPKKTNTNRPRPHLLTFGYY